MKETEYPKRFKSIKDLRIWLDGIGINYDSCYVFEHDLVLERLKNITADLGQSEDGITTLEIWYGKKLIEVHFLPISKVTEIPQK